MRKQVNEDGSVTYTLSEWERLVLKTFAVAMVYSFGVRRGFRQGRNSMRFEMDERECNVANV